VLEVTVKNNQINVFFEGVRDLYDTGCLVLSWFLLAKYAFLKTFLLD